MRAGLIASVTGHVLILVLAVVSWPDAESFTVPDVDSVPVDLIPISDLTKIQKGAQDAPIRDQAALNPGKTSDKVTETPAKKPGSPKASTAPKPSPQESQPKEVPEKQAEPEPTPPPPPKEAAPKPAPAKEALAPEPEPEKVAEAEEPVEAAPPVKETKPQPETPPKETEQQKRQEDLRKVRLTPPSKPRPVKTPKPAQQTQQASREDKFDPNQIANLLNKVDDAGGQTSGTQQQAGLGASKATSETGLSASVIDQLRSLIKRNWNFLPDAYPDDLIVRIRFHLDQSGHLTGQPEITNSYADPRFRQLAESAVRAVVRVDQQSGFNFLPPDLYGGSKGWNTVEVALRPQP